MLIVVLIIYIQKPVNRGQKKCFIQTQEVFDDVIEKGYFFSFYAQKSVYNMPSRHGR